MISVLFLIVISLTVVAMFVSCKSDATRRVMLVLCFVLLATQLIALSLSGAAFYTRLFQAMAVISAAVFLLSAHLSSNAQVRKVFSISACAAMLSTVGSVFATQSVERDAQAKPSSLVVYLCVTDEAIISATKEWVEAELSFGSSEPQIKVVGLAGGRTLVEREWPKAVFEEAPSEWRMGLTLEAIFPHIAAQFAGVAEPTSIVIAAPRASNLDEANAKLGSALKAYELLQENLHFLPAGAELGDQKIRMPDVGGISITAPSIVAPGSPGWDFEFKVSAGQLSGIVSPTAALFDPSKPSGNEAMSVDFEAGATANAPGKIRLFPAQAKLPVEMIRSPSIRLNSGKSFSARGLLPAPLPNSPTVMMIELGTKFESVAATCAFVAEAKPQFLVLQKSADLTPNTLQLYCEGTGLDTRTVGLDLSDTTKVDANAELLKGYPVLIIGCPLSNDEWPVLRDSVVKVSPSVSLLFVGSGRTAGNPSGWLDNVLKVFPVDPSGTVRNIGFAWDNSGSMGAAVSNINSKSRYQVVREMIGRFKSGFDQRNTGLLKVLAQDTGGQLVLKDINSVSDYTDSDTPNGSLEAGPALVEFDRLIATTPFSDVVIFLDPDDFERDGIASPQHVQAAKSLEQKGCRIHLVSVGGDLHPSNDQFLKDRLRVKMSDPAFSSAGMLDAELERFLYNEVFPRLTVEFESNTGAPLTVDQRSQLERCASNSSLRLIDALGGKLDRNKIDPTLTFQTILWAMLDGGGTPLLMQGPLPLSDSQTQTVTWLNTSINAEAAQRMQNDASVDTQNMRQGLANLFIASVTSASKEIKASPVSFRTSPNGRHVVAFIAEHQPFQVDAKETFLKSRTRGTIGSLDLRDLGLLTWSINSGLPAYTIDTIEAQIKDNDERIATTSQVVRVFGLPPTVISGREVDKLKLALNDAVGTTEDFDSTSSSIRVIGIPRAWYGLVIGIAMLLVAFVVYRT